MAISTEQNSVTKEPLDGVKVIAIKMPFDLQERLLTFPFLHQLRDRYPEAEIHFITPKKNIEVLNLLPFKAFYHEFDEDEIRTIFDVHRYTVTSKIFNVDLFISLTNSFVDACLGFGLRAKKRLGFSDGWKTLLFNLKTPRPVGHNKSEDFLELYRVLVGANLDFKLKVMSRNISPIIADWDAIPYIALNVCPLRDSVIENEIIDLINHYENQRIILFASEDAEKVKFLADPFLAKLSKKNSYTLFLTSDWIELGKMLAFSRGVVTFNGPAASLAAYVGAKTLILYDSEDPKRYGPFYFLSDFLMLGVNDPTLANANIIGGSIKGRKTFNMTEVFSKSLEFFRLSL